MTSAFDREPPPLDGEPRRHSAAPEFLAARAVAARSTTRAVVLVEGVSDAIALRTLAQRRTRDLAAEGVAVVPMGGATSVGRFLALFGPNGADVALAGLCDVAEERHVRRGLQEIGLGSALTREEMARHGFFVCVADLEDELIRALGTTAVEQVIEMAGELGSFRTFQQQPAQRDRTHSEQLRRFMGTRSGRKIEYARLLVERLDLARAPSPLDDVLAHL